MNRRMFGLTSFGALAAAFTPKLIAETTPSTQANEQDKPVVESPQLAKLKIILDNGSFKPGWGFDLDDNGFTHPGDNNTTGILVSIYTPHGTTVWGRKFLIPDLLLADKDFDVEGYLKSAIEQLVWQRLQQGYTV